MKISVLASGSTGNSTFIESKDSKILIDAGISSKGILNRLSYIGKDITEIDGIFITHEHSDHISGAQRLSNKFEIPVYLNKKTYESSNMMLDNPNFINCGHLFDFNDLKITPFSINHDAADPCGFKVQENKTIIGVMTDFGKANADQKQVISESDAIVLETNHDIDMLINGKYPEYLKQRILGYNGHFSNADAGLLVRDYASAKLKTVFLAHLSKNNNTEELAMETLTHLTKKKHINKILAKQEDSTELIII